MLEKGFTPDGSGPGALDLLSAQLFSFRWSASNDSEAFDDAVATMVPSLYFSQPNDSQFKFRNEPRKAARVRDEQFHTMLHCNCMPRLQPLAKSLGERSAVVCLLYCVLVSPCSLVSLGVVGFPVTTPPSTRSVSRV